MTNFGAYLMVDWSANNKPKRGEDSIWYCLVTRRSDQPLVERWANPPTRYKAISEIGYQLAELHSERMSTLVGFDFHYGYPAGLAKALGLSGGPPWRMIWDYLHFHIEDKPDNQSNRFEVAALTNKRVSGGVYPFWGCPRGRRLRHLKPTKPERPPAKSLDDLRLTDKWAKEKGHRIWSPWQLMGAGAVGSQALVGIPHLARLWKDPRLATHSLVWPFQTGLRWKSTGRRDRPLVLHAEIFPSMLNVKASPGEVKDLAQVRELAMYYAFADVRGELSKWLSGPPDLSEKERECVVEEEGWILGIENCSHTN